MNFYFRLKKNLFFKSNPCYKFLLIYLISVFFLCMNRKNQYFQSLFFLYSNKKLIYCFAWKFYRVFLLLRLTLDPIKVLNNKKNHDIVL
jgi:hypothetical protein